MTLQTALVADAPTLHPALVPSPEQRLQRITQARQALLKEGASLPGAWHEAWLERSWRRCLASGQMPEHQVSFNAISAQALRRTEEANHQLVRAARPVLDQLGQAIAHTRYFAILTNAQGVVVDVGGAIDRRDRRVDLITRIGVDMSERSVGMTAIGAALAELQPVWLHRGEHFFNANTDYSCAGAPLFGPDGQCAGMLDLTGVDVAERPELMHLAIRSVRSIENALTLGQLDDPRGLLVRLNWPGCAVGDDTDALVCLDADGFVLGANPAARQMLPLLARPMDARAHCDDLFAMAFQTLFDTARRQGPASVVDVPLWTGLRLNALPLLPQRASRQESRQALSPAALPTALKDIETALIRQAVDDARGNVMRAARALGVSRATVYRRLGAAVKRP